MFYHFSQNNSGGSFVFDERQGLTHHVIIEAHSADEANSRGEALGMYFDGEGDCPCCGDRWYPVSESDGDEVASMYGEPVAHGLKDSFHWMADGREVAVHYADGRIEWY